MYINSPLRLITFILLATVLIDCIYTFEFLSTDGEECFKKPRPYKTFNVNLIFASRNNKDVTVALNSGKAWSPQSIKSFNPKLRTAIIVHGYLGRINKPEVKAVKNELLRWQNLNVIVVDWSSGCSAFVSYTQAAANTKYAALQIKEGLFKLIKFWEPTIEFKSWGPIHFLGHSLGSHVSGQAARFLKEKGYEVARITGLDPAEPCFEEANVPSHAPKRLSREDAKFVDIIHTNAALTRNQGFGLLDPVGHLDFYVNGGTEQPGCNNFDMETDTLFESDFENLFTLVDNGVCSHRRAVGLFVDSMKFSTHPTCKFWGYKWIIGNNKPTIHKCEENTCPQMGINAELFENYKKDAVNTFWVDSRSESPFCIKRK
ncbi:hypothetical protein TKK_0000892 [Trichogramma kaykai]